MGWWVGLLVVWVVGWLDGWLGGAWAWATSGEETALVCVAAQVSDLRLDLQEAQAEWEVKLQTLRQEKAAAEMQLRRAMVSGCQQRTPASATRPALPGRAGGSC